jgi:hypothetical protein
MNVVSNAMDMVSSTMNRLDNVNMSLKGGICPHYAGPDLLHKSHVDPSTVYWNIVVAFGTKEQCVETNAQPANNPLGRP